MGRCTICNNQFSDGVQCSACGKQLDFGCAGLTEAGWRRLGTDRRSAWRCPSCRTVERDGVVIRRNQISFHPPVLHCCKKGLTGQSHVHTARVKLAASIGLECRDIAYIVNMEVHLGYKSVELCSSMIFGAAAPPVTPGIHVTCHYKMIREIKLQMAEFHEIKDKLDYLPNLVEEIKSMKADIADLKKSCNFSAGLIDDLKGRLSAAEDKINNLNSQLSNSEQRSRLNNVEIKGVPSRKDENLFQIAEAICREIGYSFPKTQINNISRVPTYNSKEKAIVICFLNRYIKEDFISAARNHKLLKAEDLGFHGSQQRVFVNDHLNSESKQLLNKVKQTAKEKKYAYVWVKFGKIHVRKNDNSGVFIVNKLSDLNKFV
ncbi:uncharacterized protein LOC123654502 [Melitaea cinxia]|uniref:uncharacterized protein LOC123654502 n=1 Tax=Melitaea cinxia TaxID=113334 RepID=UPI001E273043|nr:uncharacterized protein LOC123654502 [Melitaea cinxia]